MHSYMIICEFTFFVEVCRKALTLFHEKNFGERSFISRHNGVLKWCPTASVKVSQILVFDNV